MRFQGMTNSGLALVLLLSICGSMFDAPYFLATAQEGAGTNGGTAQDSTTQNGDPAQTTAAQIPVPAQTPSASEVPVPPTPAAECPLNCANGSVCKLGEHNFDIHPTEANGSEFTFLQTKSREGWYCECPEGYTGLRCNRPYEICPVKLDSVTGRNEDGASAKTEKHFCYHGGKCIDGLTDGSHDSIGDFQRFCDCSDAQHNGTPYFGKYCEIEGAVRCSENSEVYCTAQGNCKENFESKVYPCDCRVGHRGPHCEYMRGSVPECTLACGGTTVTADGVLVQPKEGGIGQCQLGIKDFENARYEDFWSGQNEDFQYCKCPKGWFGENCEVPGIKCGNAHCFNGGSCLESVNGNGETTYACDCRNAAMFDLKWAGQYCENAETSSCNSGSDGNLLHTNGHLFCTNGGTCKDPNNPHLGCDCPEGKFGPSCEYHHEEDSNCELKCQNGGQCRAGKKDNALIEKLGSSFGDLGLNVTHHSELFEHCVCPHNFFGIQCEHKLEICPGGDHVCLHGSKCVAQNEGGSSGELHYTCDCDSAFDSLDRYAGKFCQYTSTDICTVNGQPGMGKANFAFCVNNGICKGKVQDGEAPPGCTCPEGFHGAHCEYVDKEEPVPSVNDDADFQGYVDDYYNEPDVQPAGFKQSSKVYQQERVVLGASIGVILVVVLVMVFVVRALLKPKSSKEKAADVQDAISAEETSASGSANVSGILPQASSTDDSMEDIEVDDYVNNHSNILTDQEMTNVQIV